MKLKIRYIFFSGLGLLGLGLLIAFFFKNTQKQSQQEVVQKNLLVAIEEAKAEQRVITKQIKEKPPVRFSGYGYNSKNNYFVYQGDSLVFWSNNRYVPDYSTVEKFDNDSLLTYNNDFGILVKSKFTNNDLNYTVVSLIELLTQQERKYNEIQLNEKIFRTQDYVLSNKIQNGFSQINNSKGSPIFFFKSLESSTSNTTQYPIWILSILSLGTLFLCVSWIMQIRQKSNEKEYLKHLGYIILVVIFVKLWTILFNSSKFDLSERWPGFYWLIPNDLKITIISLLLMFVPLAYVAQYQKDISKSLRIDFTKFIVGVILVLVFIYWSVLVNDTMSRLFSTSVISQGYSFKFFQIEIKLATQLFIYVLLAVYFLLNHIVLHQFTHFIPSRKSGLFRWWYATILFGLISYFYDISLRVVAVSATYFLIAYLLNLSKFYYRLRFKTFVYFLAHAFVFSLILFFQLEDNSHLIKQQERQALGYRLFQTQDYQVEKLLEGVSEELQNSSESIANALNRPVLAYENVNYLIKDSLLGTMLSDYKIEILPYLSSGLPLRGGKQVALSQLNKTIRQKAYEVRGKPFYLIKTVEGGSDYYLFNNVEGGGTIVLKVAVPTENEIEKIITIAEREVMHNPNFIHTNVGIFDANGVLLQQLGQFEFYKEITKSLLKTNDEIIYKGYEHTPIYLASGYTLLISEPISSWNDQLSNLAYVFLLSLIGLVIFLILLTLFAGVKVYRLGFSAKIQFYLNLAFLIPISLASIFTLVVVYQKNMARHDQTLRDISFGIAELVDVQFQAYEQGRNSQKYLEEQLDSWGKTADYNVHIYSPSGRVIYKSLYDNISRVLPPNYANPEALIELENPNKKLVQYNRQVDGREYVVTYSKGRNRIGKGYGLISIVFPYSKLIQEEQIKAVIATVLRIFFIMFLVLIALSYLASSYLTHPLKRLTTNLGNVNLEQKNEELTVGLDDEVGLLTQGYNRMVAKLEESKQALAEKEKQTAWREMARQVAHEIKNPLTPMKLTIQQLQRTLNTDDPNSKLKIEKALIAINEQIDTISEIANSFSEFAKMPIPRNEYFNMVTVVESVISLHRMNSKIKIVLLKEAEEILVSGDSQILGRAVNNLILNGIQSVPENVQPQIEVMISEKENTGVVEVKDNGVGMNEEIKKKVFVPNFSTKANGSGLGLSVAKWGIEHSGGNIWFESTEGRGSVFYIDLPRSKNVQM